ncbi:MAG TPA: uroporphyrinogen-III synthase, partial [Actinomycetota bacterium]|nr:uroporphyrinogen-III synthase [Actinomycetota bacterium]
MPGLQAKRVLVLRAEHQANELAEMLSARGAQPVIVPVIRILPAKNRSMIDDALKRLHDFQWTVFTSVNGVESIVSRLYAGGQDPADGRPGFTIPTRVAAIGPATARALLAAGVVVDWMPGAYTSVALAEELPGPPSRVLLIRAEVAPTELEEILRGRGFEVERLNAYRTEATGAPGLEQALRDVDAVTFTSAWIVRCFVEAAGSKLRHLDATVCSIGPATSRACHNHGIKVDVEASEHTLPGLVDAL